MKREPFRIEKLCYTMPTFWIRRRQLVLLSVVGKQNQVKYSLGVFSLIVLQCFTSILTRYLLDRLLQFSTYGAPAATFDALQRVQNILARVVAQSARCSSAKPLLESPHWLPVRRRVTYKLATVCFKARSTSTPACLQALLVPHVPSRSLRWSHAPRLAVPRTRTVLPAVLFLTLHRPCGTPCRAMSSSWTS